jgi:hypothetical protein
MHFLQTKIVRTSEDISSSLQSINVLNAPHTIAAPLQVCTYSRCDHTTYTARQQSGVRHVCGLSSANGTEEVDAPLILLLPLLPAPDKDTFMSRSTELEGPNQPLLLKVARFAIKSCVQ